MSFLTENIFRQMATLPRLIPRGITTQAPRTFTTYPALHKTATESIKAGVHKVDRVVSDKIVDGINAAAAMGGKIKDIVDEVTPENASGKAAELRGKAKGKASEMQGEAKGVVEEAKGKVKGAAEELKGKL